MQHHAKLSSAFRPADLRQKLSTRGSLVSLLALALAQAGAVIPVGSSAAAAPARPQGPCDIYAAAGAPCVAAHSSTRALLAGYKGPLYRVLRQSDGKSIDIGVVKPVGSDPGGYADAAAQDAFCADTYCWITTLYDQSGYANHLIQPPRGAFSGPAMGGFNNLPVANMAPVTVMGHKVYGIFVSPGMGLRLNDAKATAVDDQAEGQYWVIDGRHYNSGCCFDYGNAETDSRDDGNGTMETTYFGNSTGWYYGNRPGPWLMTDQENNLVGCVNDDGSKFCPTLPSVKWRFVTQMVKGEPHHWASLGGDAQRDPLQILFDGRRIDSSYDPMRKQGAILLGNGGDNSNASQGTFYEAAMTKAGTYPSNDTDQRVQANIVTARYDVPRLTVAPAARPDAPQGLQTFAPGDTKDVTVTFTNTTGAPIRDLRLTLTPPAKGWRAVSAGGAATETLGEIAAGASSRATFRITAGPAMVNADMVVTAAWTDAAGKTVVDRTAEKIRNVPPVKINEFRVNGGNNSDANAFIELYNDSDREIDLSNWTLTQHGREQAIFSDIAIPSGTRLAAHGFYLLGLANSGLAVPAKAGDSTLNVLNTAGINAGDTVEIGDGAARESRKVTAVGTPASDATTLWQPLPEGPVITVPVGSTNVPVTSIAGFVVGQKIGIGYGATYPVVTRTRERYEVVTVTGIGKPGTQAFLGADAAPGATNIKVTSVDNISPGDTLRLDIDTMGHGIETVTVKSVGTASSRASLAAKTAAGATQITLRRFRAAPFAVGDRVNIGTPATLEMATITALDASDPAALRLTIAPALKQAHGASEDVVAPGSGLEITRPLKFAHAANMPFSARGTGISFAPATRVAHSSNEPVRPLGTGLTLDRPLSAAHPIHAVVRDAAVTTAGYQGTAAPNQWFGGPLLGQAAGAMALRDGKGLVVDSLNYGVLVDPWAAEGNQLVSGTNQGGCRVTAPTAAIIQAGPSPLMVGVANRSSGRFPDGRDTDSNCTDFRTQPATIMAVASPAGARAINVNGIADFNPGQTIVLGAGAERETAIVATVGGGGGSATTAAVPKGATVLQVSSVIGFVAGQTVTIADGTNREDAVVLAASGGGPFGSRISFATGLNNAYPMGTSVTGTGIILDRALTQSHAAGTQVTSDLPTPGGPNSYVASR